MLVKGLPEVVVAIGVALVVAPHDGDLGLLLLALEARGAGEGGSCARTSVSLATDAVVVQLAGLRSGQVPLAKTTGQNGRGEAQEHKGNGQELGSKHFLVAFKNHRSHLVTCKKPKKNDIWMRILDLGTFERQLLANPLE